MDTQLERAPVGYVILDENWKIVELNRTMLLMTGSEESPGHFRELLTISGWMYFQTYFLPAIELHGYVREMEISLRGRHGRFPALLSALKADGRYECAIMAMPIRGEYESGLLEAKREAERIQKKTEAANQQLMHLVDEIERKQSELIGLNQRFRKLATTDPLTGLSNRRAFEEALDDLLEHRQKEGTSAALIMVDIDRFKKVNDTYGHDTGDEVLKSVGRTLDQESGGFLAARVGGEEFCILIGGAGAHLPVAKEFAEHMRRAVEAADSPVSVTVSIGVAEALESDSPVDLYRRADMALYQSKQEGRNRVTVASE
ncbi:sensor domain-containing diguanylate cyclase [Edaphobacillus lindanitolerans]|uniref:Diguanylate cyclase (GGDEF) domain-containing protein n=1 Tax=Edaphobacillus lindanitolerans TaxID=550447 RepID=A0A1U7PI77_9BACI|nr:sensor domain-containing diguanylate cyclase [Edaphobacillus lindanitolerans]SIT72096.1 diguanylate cyclase (GGDEF) domain-containing protein [Edaphobacillus lindanitolerans]